MLLTVAVMLLLPAGCSSVPPDAGFSDVNGVTGERTGYATAWTRGAEEDAKVNGIVAEWLSDQLTLEEAIKVALLNNRNLQAIFEQLGVSRGQLIQAGIIENPVFGGDWWDFDEGTAFEGLLTENIISIITVPMRRQLRGNEFRATKLAVTAEVVHLVGDVKRAYFLYQANRQLVEMFQMTVQATKSSYMAMARLREAGNTRQLDVFQERVLYEEAKVALNAAVEQLARSREQLNVLMGLWGPQTAWETPPRLPDLPVKQPQATESGQQEPADMPAVTSEQFPSQMKPVQTDPGESSFEAMAEGLAGPPANDQLTVPTAEVVGSSQTEPGPQAEAQDILEASSERYEVVERMAVEHSLDLASAWHLVEAQVGRLRLDTTLAIFPFLDLGATSEYTTDDEWGVGPAVDTPIPVFDWGQGQVPEELSRLSQRLERYAALAVSIRAVARTAEARLQATRARALYMRDVVLPLHAALVAEAQLQYNAMQISPFQLLQTKTQQILAGQQYIAALLEYWIARSDLEQLLDGSLPPGVLAHGVAATPGGGLMLVPQITVPGLGQ